LLVLAALLVASCSNDPNPEPLHKTRADGTPWVVRYASMSDEARSLDPQVTYDQMSKMITEAVYDCLLQYHPMKTEPYEVEPSLLEAMPERPPRRMEA
jgi:ABC-type oligopeptide transport system substrate-binding subunit